MVEVALDVVVVDDVHKVECVVYPLKQLEAFRFRLVNLSPFAPTAEGLVFPDHESSKIDDCRLNDLLVHENAPSYCVDSVGLHVGH